MKKSLLATLPVAAFVAGVAVVPSVFAEDFSNITTAETLSSCLQSATEQTCVLGGDINDFTGNLSIGSGQAITLDLKGYTIDNTSGDYFTVVKNGSSLTVKGSGGKIVNKNQGSAFPAMIWLYGGSDASTPTKLNIEKGATLEGILPVDFDKGDNAYFDVNIAGDLVNNTGATKLNGGGTGIWINGALKTPSAIKLNITGSVSSILGAAIYQGGIADTTVNGGSLTGLSAVVIKAGNLTLNNANLLATGTYQTVEKTPNDGYLGDTGAVIQVESHSGYAGNVNVEFNGGSYVSRFGNIVDSYGAETPEEEAIKEVFVAAGNEFKTGEGKGLFAVDSNENFEPTLAEGVKLVPGANGEIDSVIAPESEPTTPTEPEETITNPNTADSIALYTTIAALSLIGLGTTIFTAKKARR